MYTKAVDLKEFYDTLQGRVVQRVLRHHLRSLWADVKGLRVLGVGYPIPFLRVFTQEAERVVALMPPHQGAVFWPSDEKGLVAVSDEGEWPIETNSIDRLFVIHSFNGADSLDLVLREAWRVLNGQGQLVLMTPNRSGIWARFDNTPFGHGIPYSMGQMRHFLKEYMFVPERAERALFFPPSASRLTLVTAGVWEKIGSAFFNAFGGVNIVEATKQVYSGTLVGVTNAQAVVKRRRLLTATEPASRVDTEIKQG